MHGPATLPLRRNQADAGVVWLRKSFGAGCDGVTLFGTTGEGPAFTVEERKGLLESMRDDQNKGKK